MKIIVPSGGIGDEVALTPAVRELRRRRPSEKITLQGLKYASLWSNNPHAAGGTIDTGDVVTLDHGGRYMDAGSLPRKFARQFGIELVDDTPEIFLTEAERRDLHGLQDWTKTLTVDTWSRDSARRWGLDRFQEAVDRLRIRGWRVVHVGKHNGPAIACDHSLLNRLSIRATAAAIARSSVYLGNDSGLLHVAAAVGTPQVGLFGRVPARFRAYWTTLGLGTMNRCLGCGPFCKDRPEGASCLEKIAPELAVEAVELQARRHSRKM